MQRDNILNYLHLHFLVLIAGFTAALGALISLDAFALVWYRMLIAAFLMLVFIRIKKIPLRISFKDFKKFFAAGILIALHWITFFAAIKVSNISITLAMFSTGAIFASLLEPIILKRSIYKYEIILGVVVVVGVYLITKSELQHLQGIILGISSAFFSSFFSVLNGKLIKTHAAITISFYEFICGVFFISVYLLFSTDGFHASFFELSISDWFYLLLLASICTAYAFVASVHILRYISPFTMVLTYNLEPIYGILIAVLLFPSKEVMSLSFYLGSVLIVLTVIINVILKKTYLKKIRS